MIGSLHKLVGGDVAAISEQVEGLAADGSVPVSDLVIDLGFETSFQSIEHLKDVVGHLGGGPAAE